MTSVISGLVDSLCAQARQMASFVSQLSATSSINTFNKVSQPTLTTSLICKGKDLFVYHQLFSFQMKAFHFHLPTYNHVVTLIYPTGQPGWEDYLGQQYMYLSNIKGNRGSVLIQLLASLFPPTASQETASAFGSTFNTKQQCACIRCLFKI